MYRSRLQTLEGRRYLRKVFLLTVGFIAALWALILLGLPVLTSVAIFLGQLNASAQKIDKADNIPPAPPQLFTAYEATNSAKQVISGYSEPTSTVYLNLNGETKSEQVVGEDGRFKFDFSLTATNNHIQVYSIDAAGNKSASPSTYDLEYSNKLPKLSIDGPQDNQVITGNPAKAAIKGSTEGASQLFINGRPIPINSKGVFEVIWELPEGETTLYLIATDRFGNQVRRQLTVTAKP